MVVFVTLKYGRQRLSNQNSVIKKFAENNEYKVTILQLNDTWLPNGKFPPRLAVNCIVEGLKTKERRFLTLSTKSELVPLSGEVWVIGISYSFYDSLYTTKEDPGVAYLILDHKV